MLDYGFLVVLAAGKPLLLLGSDLMIGLGISGTFRELIFVVGTAVLWV